MSDDIKVKIAPTRAAPVEAVRLVTPNNLAELVKCECYVSAGFFFDGTGNNNKNDLPKLKHSNIARLFSTYRAEPKRGYFGIYIPGVGTNFPLIGEFGESDLGNGFGIGCEARVLYAMLSLFNLLYSTAFGQQEYFSGDEVRVLCSVGKRAKGSHADLQILAKLGLSTGLLMPDFFGVGQRNDFFLSQSKILASKLTAGKPIIKECFIDVFGFSRGAAEARVFCSWLERILVAGKFSGIPIRFRFVGLMDTVASGGFWSSVGAGIKNVADGHSGWAAVEYLRLPNTLENCVHMVAMHELRKNFPLDEAGLNGSLPPNTQEFAYPGSHSDVGGGYEANELGVSGGKDMHQSDALKLSQIPLNHMFDCAIAAGAPMDKKRADTTEKFDAFATSPLVTQAYFDFLATSTMAARPLSAWLQPYLNWRWQNRLVYAELSHVKKASKSDKALLQKFNKILIGDAELIERATGPQKTSWFLSLGNNPFAKADLITVSMLDSEARSVLGEAKKASKIAAPIHNLFDNYVHDSLAGFNSTTLETTGYWRYRKGFVGGGAAGIVMNEQKDDGTEVA